MKPFNLEAAKAGKPIVTRDGRVAKFVAHVPEAREDHQLVILITGTVCTRTEAGLPSVGWKTAGDLFMAEEEITVYFNQYADGSFGCVRDSMGEAADAVSSLLPPFVKTHAVKIKV